MNERLRQMIVGEDRSIRDTMEAIGRGRTGTAFVVDRANRLVGLVTDGDIRRAILKNVSFDVSIRTVMNTAPVILRQGFVTEDVQRMMLDRHIMCLPVLADDGRVVDFIHLPALIEESRRPRPAAAKRAPEVSRVLVIGGAGYIGSLLTRELLDRGHRVRVFDSLLYGDESLAQARQSDRFQLVRGDTRNVEAIVGAVRDTDAVVHLGEIVGDPACQINPDFTIDVNYSATKTIAEACRNVGVARFVFTSSCSVYGAGDELFDEDSALNPVSLYARCKIEAERALMSLADGAFFPTVFRLATVFGLSPRPRFDLVVNLLTAQAVTRGRIVVMGGGQWRPFVHVRDVAEVIADCLAAPAERVGGRVFNLGSDEENRTIADVAEIIRRVVPGLVVERKDVDGDPRNYRVSFARIRQQLGAHVKRTVEDGVAEIRTALLERRISDFTERRFSNYQNLVEV